MKLFKAPSQPPTIADRLVIDAAELHAFKVYSALQGAVSWYTWRRSTHVEFSRCRVYLRASIQETRKILKQAPPATSKPLLRLEDWQLQRDAAYQQTDNAELARRLTLQTSLVKMLHTYDPRRNDAAAHLEALREEAAKRFAGLFYPHLAFREAA